jgi:hypothetical protein
VTVGRELRCAFATAFPRLRPGASRPRQNLVIGAGGGKSQWQCGTKLRLLEAAKI